MLRGLSTGSALLTSELSMRVRGGFTGACCIATDFEVRVLRFVSAERDSAQKPVRVQHFTHSRSITATSKRFLLLRGVVMENARRTRALVHACSAAYGSRHQNFNVARFLLKSKYFSAGVGHVAWVWRNTWIQKRVFKRSARFAAFENIQKYPMPTISYPFLKNCLLSINLKILRNHLRVNRWGNVKSRSTFKIYCISTTVRIFQTYLRTLFFNPGFLFTMSLFCKLHSPAVYPFRD